MMRYFIIALRPRHWVKNFFVIAPLFFSKRMFELGVVSRTLLFFILFCLLSSSVYLINDIIDKEQDRKHPKKSKRPLPLGLLSVKVAFWGAVVLFLIVASGSFFLDKRFFIVGMVYWGMNLAYTLLLKQIVIVDVICLALGFVLRVIAGGIAVEVYSSPWILVTTFFLSLFLGFAKRRSELTVYPEFKGDESRSMLEYYNIKILDKFLTICATASIMSYALFTLAGYTLQRFGTHQLVYTIPFVVYGVFRFSYLVYFADYENPTDTLFSDKALMLNLLTWVITVVFIIYK